MKEGIEKGMKEGMKQGSISTQYAIAKNLKAMGIGHQEIQKATGLSIAEIENL